MAIMIRQADLEEDRPLLIQSVATYINPKADEKRFEWLYLRNPAGPACAWIALEENGQFVGMASAFPRRVLLAGAEHLCWVLGDFCIHDRYRTLGPALQLQRTIIAECAVKNVNFWYDFPSRRMVAVYRRLGVEAPDQVVRLAKLLRVDGLVHRYLPCRPIGGLVSAVGNTCVRVFEKGPRTDSALRVDVFRGCFDDEFTALATNIGSSLGGCIVRSAEYLNWRYASNPLYQYETLTARRFGKLVGYVVIMQEEGQGVIVDLFGTNEANLLEHLVSSAITRLRGNGAHGVSVPITRTHPSYDVFRRLRFVARERIPMVCQIAKFNSVSSRGGFDGFPVVMSGERDC